MGKRTFLTGAAALAAAFAFAAPARSQTAMIESQTFVGGPDRKVTWTVKAERKLYDMLPASARQSGTLNAATHPASPPGTFVKDDVLSGVDIELGNAVAAKLGVKTTWSQVKFAAIIPGIQSNRYDFALSTMGDNFTREKVVDFVDYRTQADRILVRRGNPRGVRELKDLCGLKVVTTTGSSWVADINRLDAQCEKKMDIGLVSDLSSAALAVQSGQFDATFYPGPSAEYLAKYAPDQFRLQMVATPLHEGWDSIPFSKSNTATRDAVQAALTALKKDGIYDKMLETWAVSSGALDAFPINDANRFYNPDDTPKARL